MSNNFLDLVPIFTIFCAGPPEGSPAAKSRFLKAKFAIEESNAQRICFFNKIDTFLFCHYSH